MVCLFVLFIVHCPCLTHSSNVEISTEDTFPATTVDSCTEQLPSRASIVGDGVQNHLSVWKVLHNGSVHLYSELFL